MICHTHISIYHQLLNQLDGFDDLGKVKMVMATNRPDTLDPALLRPGEWKAFVRWLHLIS